MRRFEFVGGTSAKFWEIERVGTTVTVRFGRLGTNGQTQAKDLATDAAAIAHLDKLVAEKVKKGYVETATGSSPAAVAAPAPPAPAAPAPEPVPVPKPAPEPAPAVDEDSWTVPTSWWRLAEPFRGLGPVRTLSLRKNAADQVARVIESTKAKVAVTLSHPQSDKELVEAAKGYVSGRSPTPLGAAVVATAVTKHCGWGAERDALPSFADDWVATYGMTFAAEAGALLATVRFLDPAQRSPYIGRAPAQDLPVYHVRAILARLRALLAFASDDDYATAVARLGKLRNGPAIQVVCSYLAPTEQQWVDEDLAGSLTGLSGADMGAVMLLVSATTRRQAGKAMKTSTARSRVMYSSEALYSLAANVGPETAADVAGLFDDAGDADTLRRLLSILTQFPTDEAFELLADRVDQKYVEPALLETMERFPRRAFRVLARQAGGRGRTAAKAKQLLRMHALSHPDLADQVRPDLGEEAAALLVELTTDATVPTAAPDSLPPLLVAPPWTNQRARSRPVVVAVDASPSPLRLVWEPGEQQAWAELDTGDRWLSRTADWRALIQRTVGGYDWRQIAIFAHAPADLVRPLLRSATPHDAWGAEPALRRVLGRFGDEAVAYVARAAFSKPASLAPALLPMEGVEVASRMAEWHARAKSIRPVAARWFDRHAESAARDLLPAALGKPGKARTLAEDALRLLAVRGHDAVVRRVAATHGSEAAGAVDQLLGLDPLEILPARIPDLPSWLFPAHLRPAVLKDRSAALPAEAVGHVCTMLAMSKLGESYAGIEVVREALDPPSLADMAWSVFERWGSAGYPSKDGWVLDAQGLVGDDETVRRLAPLIRAWPGEAAHARAVAGLDVLSEIGSDVALMHLHGIAEKAKFKGLKTKAKERMDAVADGLGLTAEQLADRLVPDFGLDADGSVVLDYGPRRFRVGFDEQLKPLIVDEDGARRKVLPKPAAKDDPTLAPDAYARFSGLKKDVKTIAADQIRRLERAMVAGRRWTAAEQRTLFVDHPLLWHLARRLVWGTFDQSGSLSGSFRVAEDRTLADSGDEEIHVPDDAAVGIPHPLHLGGAIGAWSDLFADYEILQPFAQLGREVLALTPEERRSRRLTRYEGIKVATGKVLGLSYRGWERGIPQDAGVSHVAYKPVPGGRAVVISLDPGIVAGMAMEFPVQTISEVWLSDGPAEWANANGDLVFDLLDPITASEALRDLEALRT